MIVIRTLEMLEETRRKKAFALVEEELRKAQATHGPMLGPHEGYAVLLEEVDELWDEVKAQRHDRERLRKEAAHVGAMAVRFLIDVCDVQ